MILYLDESKKLGEGKIIVGGFFTSHNNNYIEKFIKQKRYDYRIGDTVELKGTKPIGQKFYNAMSGDMDFSIIEHNLIVYSVNNYFRDDIYEYTKILIKILSVILEKIKNGENIMIIADRITFCDKIKKSELCIEKLLQNAIPHIGKIKFIFGNSASFSGIQLADICIYQVRKKIFYNIPYDDFMLRHLI